MNYDSKATVMASFSDMRNTVLLVGGALGGIIGLIGILNFINAVLTSIVSRKRVRHAAKHRHDQKTAPKDAVFARTVLRGVFRRVGAGAGHGAVTDGRAFTLRTALVLHLPHRRLAASDRDSRLCFCLERQFHWLSMVSWGGKPLWSRRARRSDK